MRRLLNQLQQTSAFRAGLLLLSILLLSATALADGGYFSASDNSRFYVSITNSQQRAWIYCDGATEHLLVALTIPNEGKRVEDGLWILPVKGRPDQVNIQLLAKFPKMRGLDIDIAAKQRVDCAAQILFASQIWSLVPMSCLLPSLNRAAAHVETEVEAMGLRTQLVTVDSLEALHDHLKTLTPAAPTTDQLATFEPYLHGEYVFLVTSVRSAEQAALHLRERYQYPALYVTFPSASPWYPMRGTRLYGVEKTPVLLHVMGDFHLTDPTYANDARQTWFNTASSSDVPKPISASALASGRYLRLTLNGMPAKDFATDMTFTPGLPPSIQKSLFILSTPGTLLLTFITLLIHLSLSALAGAIAGAGHARSWQLGVKVGLANIATLLMVWVTVRFINRRTPQTFIPGFLPVFSCSYLLLLALTLMLTIGMPF